MRPLEKPALFVLLASCATCCILGLRLEGSQVPEQPFNLPDSSRSTTEHCASTQRAQYQDDTMVDAMVMLQSGRVKAERLIDDEWEAQRGSSLPTQQGDHAKVLTSSATRQGQATASLLSTFQVTSKSEWLRGAMLIWSLIWIFLPVMYCMIVNFRDIHLPNTSSFSRTSAPAGAFGGMSGECDYSQPLTSQSMPQPVGRTQDRSRPNSSGPPTVGQLNPFSYSCNATPNPTLQNVPSTQLDQQVLTASERSSSPLCSTLVLPVCGACFGVPMSEIANLNAEGKIHFVGVSGETLLHASVSKLGMQRVLHISTNVVGCEPHVSIRSNWRDPNLPDDDTLEILGPKESFYGLLHIRRGSSFVTHNEWRTMSIDRENDRLELRVTSGGGAPLASTRCSTEQFGGIEHLEIQVERGADVVLVLACILAVLIYSPPT